MSYFTKLPKKNTAYQVITETDVKRFMSSTRARFDMNLRMKILNSKDGDTVVSRKPENQWYWEWFAETLKVHLKWSGNVYVPSYSRGLPMGLFTSAVPGALGGVESTIGTELMYNGFLTYLSEPNYNRAEVGMIEGFLAILGPAMGYAVTCIGDERYSGSIEDRSQGEHFSDRYAIEQTESWWRMWNAYVGPYNSVISLVGVWTKPELIVKASKLGHMPNILSCFNTKPERPWCGECWKCASIKLVLDHNRLDSSFIPDTPPAYLEKIRSEIDDYKRGIDPFRSTGMLEGIKV